MLIPILILMTLKAIKKNDLQGQSLTEFLLVLLCLIGVALPIASYWILEWKKLRCSYWVFETAHASLMRHKLRRSIKRMNIQTEQKSGRIIAWGLCGGEMERVELAELETAVWK